MVSQVHPLYDGRYVVFSQPALALLCAAGLSWLAGVAGRAPRPGLVRRVAWLPPAEIIVLLGILLVQPQQAVRRPGSRADNPRLVYVVLAARERPGDAVLYLPAIGRIGSMAYPAPFRRLRDIALARSPVASATLAWTEVSPDAPRHRFTGVQRVWLVTIGYRGHLPLGPGMDRLGSGMERVKIVPIAQLHQVGLWRTGADVLRRYEPYVPGRGGASTCQAPAR